MRNIKTNVTRLNSDAMKELKLKQVQYEKETWKRVLYFMSEENICLKNRLSEVLKDPFNYNWLEQLECFQTSFVKFDNLVHLLRDDLAEVETLLTTGIPGEDNTLINMRTKLLALRNVVTTAEKEFIKLKIDFINYLSENVWIR